MSNSYINIFCNVILQVSIIFAFLTLFFFSYVINVEKEEFEQQINFIVDNIYKRYQDSFNNIYKQRNEENRNYIKLLIYGMIDIEQEKLKKDSIKENEEIKKENQKIYQDSMYYVKLFLVISIVIIIGLTYLYDLSIKNYIYEAFILLFFIFIVEFVFLNIIVKKYITANPNSIKNKIASSIIQYINKKDKYNIK